MDVSELHHLADWYIDHYTNLNSLYNAVLSPIQHNANQPGKQPVENQLDSLLSYLRTMKFDELSLQQLRMLSTLGVDRFVGSTGSDFIEAIIRTSDYDPATAATKINQALSTLSEAHSGFSSYRKAIEALKIADSEPKSLTDTITVRVGFQSDASIENITDWKVSAQDWYDIIRGLALAANEAPEDTKIVGASTGSIILILAGTLSVTTLLALISKNIASVAKDIIGIRNQIETLRQQKLLTTVIEKELKKQETTKKDQALKEIISLIKKQTPGLDGEQVTADESSIKKLLTFNEKGGNVDFVAPDTDGDDPDEDESEGNEERRGALAAVRSAIHEYQEVREQIKLLSDFSNNQN